jgi:hypothetical protein
MPPFFVLLLIGSATVSIARIVRPNRNPAQVAEEVVCYPLCCS